jgi:putative membrane-bound dehydrogenase-like protein
MIQRGWIIVLGFFLLGIPTVASAQEQAAAAPGPLAVEAARKEFRLATGLRIELVAAEPEVQSPVAMAFDADGRLWVVEMLDYPNGPPPGQPPEGRIKILQDRDGSGRYRTTSIFADRLLFANGVLPWRDGVLATAAPHILYLGDTDGDGKADQREVLYEGFATANPQLRVSHPQLGIDNWVHVVNGLKSSQARRSGRADAPVIDISGRDFRFDPVRDRAEAITGLGQYGNTFDAWGQRFVCSNRNHWVHIVLPEHYVRRNPFLTMPPPPGNDQRPGGAARVYPLSKQEATFPEHFGSFTAACGVFIYREHLLPSEHHGAIFTCEPTGNLVHQEVLLPRGATFTGRPVRAGVEFLATTDSWFRPVFLTSGPDGALYLVDMGRKVVEHPEYMPKAQKNRPDVLEGKERGRIWRIVPDRPAAKPTRPNLSKASPAELVELLSHPGAWWRTTAQRLLLERQDPQAERLLGQVVLTAREPVARAHAAWLLEHRGKLEVEQVQALLQHEQPRLREHGVRLAERWLARSEAVQKRVLELAGDADARVRFQAALSLGEWDDDRILKPLARIALADADDPWTRLAVASSVPRRAGALLAILLQRDVGLTRQTTEERLQLVQELAALVGGRRDPGEVGDFLELLLGLSGAEASRWRLAGRKGLAEGMLRRGTQLAAFVQTLPAPRRDLLERLDARMGQTLTLARDGKGNGAERLEAVQMLAHADWKTAEPVLRQLVSAEPAVEVRRAAVRALAAFPNPEVSSLLVKAWPGLPPGLRGEAAEVLLSQPERALALLQEMEAGRISPGDLEPLRRVQLLNHRRSDIRERSRKLFQGAATTERRKVLEDYRAALRLAGDLRRGRELFQKATCASCHRVGGQGTDVGPDISDTRTKSLEALLVDILDPNAAIDANYLNYLVALKNGKVVTGSIAGETASSIVLRRADNQVDVVLRQDIEPGGIVSSGQSLMPEGLEKNLSPQDLADLLAFLKGWRDLDRPPPGPPGRKPGD